MKVDHDTYPKGHTLDDGRYVFIESPGVCGEGLWLGEQLQPVHRPVCIAFRYMTYSDELDASIRIDVPGLAPILFIGLPDGYSRPLRFRPKKKDIAVVVARPSGDHLSDTGSLGPAEVVRLGLGLCDTIVAWHAEARIFRGIRPETVYVTGPPGQRRFAGATPQLYYLLGGGRRYGAYPLESYDPPSQNAWSEQSLDDVLFTCGMVLWSALLGEHPYDVPGHGGIDHNIWEDIRRPFTGPPELGRLLERVLVSDIDERMKTDELRHELERLARAWNVELPPFPPPGLAER